MTLVKYKRPSRDFDFVDWNLNSLFDSFLGNDCSVKTSESYPKANIVENVDNYLIQLDVPGLSREQINVSYKDQILTISGERQDERNVEKEKYVSREISYGKFSRSFTLPDGVDTGKIDAQFKEGVLEITVVKPEKQKAKEIEINIK